MDAPRNVAPVRAEAYVGGGRPAPEAKGQKRLAVPVRFFVNADSLEEARDRVRQVIEHGQAVHDPDIEWEWGVGP